MSVRRQTLASSSQDAPSSIPMPMSTIRMRPPPPPSSSLQLSQRPMRMSMVPPPRPQLQQSQSGPSTNPRQSMYRSQAASNARLGQSATRGDAGHYGKPPSQSARRASQSKARGGIPHYPLPAKDVRPIRDRNFQAQMARTVFEYLQTIPCPVNNLSLKTLQSPTLKDFQAIFRSLISHNDPQYQFGKANKKFEDEFLILLKDLRYPHADQITKTHLTAANSHTSWPAILAVLYWIVEWTKLKEKWLSENPSNDPFVTPVDLLKLDDNDDHITDVINFHYLETTYKAWWDDENTTFSDQDEKLALQYQQKSEGVMTRCDEKQAELNKLTAELEALESQPSPLAEMEQKWADACRDHQKYEHSLKQHQARVTKYQVGIQDVEKLIVEKNEELAAAVEKRNSLETTVRKQNLTPEEVARMASERDTLIKNLEDLRARVAEASKNAWDREISLSKRGDTVETLVSDYMTLAYKTGLHPTPPGAFAHVDFSLELNVAVSNPRDMLKADISGTIKPALMAIAEEKRKERAQLDHERIKLEDELDRLVVQCETMREELQSAEVGLGVVLEQADGVKENASAETAASNAEAGKLERDVAMIATAVQQSELAAKSRLSALEVEYADTVHKVEKLKESTIKEIVSHTESIIQFKQEVANKLDSLVLFAEQN